MKRVLDIVVSSLVLLSLFPLMAVVALAIRLEDGGPIIYRQRRVGRHSRGYDLLKFRSLRVHNTPAEQLGQVREDHPLVTRVGRVIRRFKIDELPQLCNVLRGDMSLVGPRPTLPEQVARYSGFERRRLLLRPGMTGWAQVNGNTQLAWPERIALDIWYLDHRSLWLDLTILAKTFQVILRGEWPNTRAVQEALFHANHACRRG
jgi:lipopolysaccharide/colanic/teichoic acid biosynthesis glycosyltransferase